MKGERRGLGFTTVRGPRLNSVRPIARTQAQGRRGCGSGREKEHGHED
jgi:hypothetical protein